MIALGRSSGRVALLMCCVLLTATVARSQENCKPSKEPFSALLDKANAGDEEAQFSVGEALRDGKIVPKDAASAILWFRRSAEKGLDCAQVELAFMYALGRGVPEDDDEAVRLLQMRSGKSGSLSSSSILSMLGEMYEHGNGAPRNPAKAIFWYRKAADQGYAGASYSLAAMYYFGEEGIPKDALEAIKWYRKAADQGFSAADLNIGEMYRNGEGVPKDLSQAAVWYGKGAANGDADAQFSLGLMYDGGEGVPRDYETAAKWYSMAAEQGHAGAQNNLGVPYREGEGVPRDRVTAYMWLNLAAVRNETARANRDKLENHMNEVQIIEGQRLTREWFAKHQNAR